MSESSKYFMDYHSKYLNSTALLIFLKHQTLPIRNKNKHPQYQIAEWFIANKGGI